MNSRIEEAIDWPVFMSRHDMLWSTRPISWDEGVFLGNGMLGAMMYSEEHRDKRNVLRFVLGRSDITASRPGNRDFPVRVPIGELALELEGWIYQPCEIRLDLWNAELRAVIPTTKGEVRIRALIHATAPVLLVELDADEGEHDAKLKWYAYPEVDPVLKNADGINLNQFIPETTVQHLKSGEISIGVQEYGSGEGCTTAWLTCRPDPTERKLGKWNRQTCILTVMKGVDNTVRDQAVQELRAVPLSTIGWEAWLHAHRQWWHHYYPESFISIPDTQLESFYWIQMYKLASATRADSLPIDNQGPWLTSTPWPGLWFNMNVQMSYSPIYTANRLHLGMSLIRSLQEHQEQLIRNVPEAYRKDSAGLGRSSSYDLHSPVTDEVGNLTWVMHNCWRHCRYAMDDNMLQDVVYPLLRRSVCLYLHLLEEGQDGRLHLPPTVSPEYGSFKQLKIADAHYDLALLRWGCETLIRITDKLGIHDSLHDRWRDVLDRLVPFPIDSSGYMIGENQRLDFGHRHFSHLLAAFPLQLVGDTEEERELILRSLRHWIGLEGDLRGFSFTGAASIAAILGLGDEALAYLRSLMHLIKPNTMYKEAGPVIETPLAGAESIHDMLLQSRGERISVFPAVPEEWPEAVFHRLRSEGGFLVSAVREEGRTAWIHICSLAGGSCRIATDMVSSPDACLVLEIGGMSTVCPIQADGSIHLVMQAGEEAYIYSDHWSGSSPFKISPIPAEKGKCNMFGSRKPWRLYGIPR
ncbi:glycosyl hydrolase family 95 catalytic domain-containing protein [Paenibacillus lautus]